MRAELAELEGLARTLSDAEWVMPCSAESWPAGFVAFHIARGFQRQAEFVEQAVAGGGPHVFDWGDTHALNASVIAAHPSPTRDDVISLARTSVDRMAAAVDGRADADLERVAFVYEGHERSVLWVLRSLAVHHARGHRESIAAALS